MTRARGCQCGDADVCAVIHEMSIERDSLRAQVAELRGAVLGSSWATGARDGCPGPRPSRTARIAGTA
jgi:hypothetical protein